MATDLSTDNIHLKESSEYDRVVPVAALLGAARERNAAADTESIERAYDFARQAHEGQKRFSGSPYFCHVSQVAFSLAELGLDAASIAAALLHDTVEDTRVSLEDIEREFSAEIAALVDGVTKISTRVSKSGEDHQAENLRKMIVAMAKDIRVLLVKLADRLHNLRTLSFLSREKQARIARETMEVYAPLAHRLGIARWKWELEDRCMSVLYAEEYKSLVSKVNQSQGDRDNRLREAADRLETALAKEEIKAEIAGRAKHLWSIYQKILNNHKKFEEIYDLVALRVVTPTLPECYAAMGIVHSLWTPMPGRMKDYIAMPKSNMYQSLHSTVMGPGGLPLEIQFRTEAMHRTAEEGIAAHWTYKAGGTKKGSDPELPFLNNLLEWQQENKDTKEFMEFLKIDLYDDDVFVFTPQGEVKILPQGASAIDFAYSVHSKVGDQCYGAMVNGKMAPLRQELSSGDIVRVLTSPGHKPSKDWLHVVQTSKAKNRIRHALKAEQKQNDIARGQEMLEKELKRQKIQVKDLYKSARISDLSAALGYKEIDDLLVALSNRQLTARKAVLRLTGEAPVATLPKPRNLAPDKAAVHRGIEVRGVSDALVQFARCCGPIYGDPVMGYITVGRGVSVHRADCTNVADLSRRVERLVEVSWVGLSESRPVELEATAFDRPGLLADMLVALAQTKGTDGKPTGITAAAARSIEAGMARGTFTVQIDSLDHLKQIMLNLYQIEGVSSVKRKERRTRKRGTESSSDSGAPLPQE